jgi:ribosomal protein S18 acetylase RimI-like enzyme
MQALAGIGWQAPEVPWWQSPIPDDACYVAHIAVDDAWQGRGIGARLMRGIAADPRWSHAREIWLDVFAGSRRAVAFYERLGFTLLQRYEWVTVSGQKLPFLRMAQAMAR